MEEELRFFVKRRGANAREKTYVCFASGSVQAAVDVLFARAGT